MEAGGWGNHWPVAWAGGSALLGMVMMHVSWRLGLVRGGQGPGVAAKAGDTTREQHIASDMVVHNGRTDELGMELRAQLVRGCGRVHEKGLRKIGFSGVKAAATYGTAGTDSHNTAATDSQNTAATDSHSTAAWSFSCTGQGKEARKLMAREAGPKDDRSQTPGQARNRLL